VIVNPTRPSHPVAPRAFLLLLEADLGLLLPPPEEEEELRLQEEVWALSAPDPSKRHVTL
jgi:hypothetical protein